MGLLPLEFVNDLFFGPHVENGVFEDLQPVEHLHEGVHVAQGAHVVNALFRGFFFSKLSGN